MSAPGCPFCGDSDPAIDEIERGVWAVVCNGCGCIGPVENYDQAEQSPERAIELWNRRVNRMDWPVEWLPMPVESCPGLVEVAVGPAKEVA